MNQGQKFVFGKKAKNKQTQGTELWTLWNLIKKKSKKKEKIHLQYHQKRKQNKKALVINQEG